MIQSKLGKGKQNIICSEEGASSITLWRYVEILTLSNRTYVYIYPSSQAQDRPFIFFPIFFFFIYLFVLSRWLKVLKLPHVACCQMQYIKVRKLKDIIASAGM